MSITLQLDPANANLVFRTGDDYRIRVTYTEVLTNDITGEETETRPDLTNVNITSKARTAYAVDADSFTLPVIIADQTKERGVFYIIMRKDTTAQFRPENRPRKFQYDIQSVDADGWTSTFCEGTLTFTQDNTY